MFPRILKLSNEWELGDQIGAGGYGKVFIVKRSDGEAVAKFVPKAAGASRELLFVELKGIKNVMPIIDSGEIEDFWVLVMPKANYSLRDFLNQHGKLDIVSAVNILKDIADALVDLEGGVVHRDLKPENVLFFRGKWCLADFGISRYAEATTSTDTHKFAMSPPYAAPERWLLERATSATDVYSVGVMAFEMLSGKLPFVAQEMGDWKDQHLNAMPRLDGITPRLTALVQDCMAKLPQARPVPKNLRARLERAEDQQSQIHIPTLEEANLLETRRREQEVLKISQAQSLSERRHALAEVAKERFAIISEGLRNAIRSAAPSAVESPHTGGFNIKLGNAVLVLSKPGFVLPDAWGEESPEIDVIMISSLKLSFPADQWGYEGRGHSLWFCDAQEENRFNWFETAFMFSPLLRRDSPQKPFGMGACDEAALALSPVMSSLQVAWPFTELLPDDLTEFIQRWGEWLGKAAQGTLHLPSTMPEKTPRGSWRRK